VEIIYSYSVSEEPLFGPLIDGISGGGGEGEGVLSSKSKNIFLKTHPNLYLTILICSHN
jgi:hypothetical protein